MDNKHFLNKFPKPSPYYEKFIRDYISYLPMIAGRGDEDISVWNNLEGDELETAKQFILESLEEKPEMSYIRAVGIFRDPKALPILEKIINELPERYLFEKLYAAKILYDWRGYKDYLNMLEFACLDDNEQNRSYLKVSLYTFIDGLDEAEKQRIYHLLNI